MGIKHLIECHCILPQFKKKDPPVYHKFTVYSKIENNKFVEKFSQCNNCGIIHKITDICKSEIMVGKEDYNAGLSVKDMMMLVSDKISKILQNNNCDYATWEQVVDIIESESWGEYVVLKRDIIDSKEVFKVLQILEAEKIKLYTKIIEDEIIGEGLL